MGQLELSYQARASLGEALSGLISSGGLGELRLYTGGIPSNPETSLSTQGYLGSCQLTSVSEQLGGVSGLFAEGVMSGSGTVSWARLVSGDNTVIADFVVGTGQSPIVVDTTVVATGDVVVMSSMNLTVVE